MHGHPPRQARTGGSLAVGACTLAEMGVTHSWRDRPVLVTGATGLLGGWVVDQLQALGSSVVALIRDWEPDSRLVRSGAVEGIRVVRGDIVDQPLIERILGEYEVRTVFHLAAQT